MLESDLYPPLKHYLQTLGFDVKSEINHCDIVARNGDAMLIVEIKTALNLTVLLQGVDRLALNDNVYLAVPKKLAVLKKQRRRVVKLMRMLGLGLLVVDPAAQVGAVDVLCEPGPYLPRKNKRRTAAILKEFAARKGDPNMGGGATRNGITTAYRQQATAIAAYLAQHGPTSTRQIKHAVGIPHAASILQKNHNQWFERVERGVYTVSTAWRDAQ